MAEPDDMDTDADAPLPFKDLDEFLIDVHPDSTNGGKLWLLPAGKRSSESFFSYANSVVAFDWLDLYKNWEGELYFEWLRRQLEDKADVILIDSRTGVTEIGGICTYQLADTVVMFCSANQQNIEGTRRMAERFKSEEVNKLRPGRPLDVLIVPARIEKYESAYLDKFEKEFVRKFSSFVSRVKGDELWNLHIPYVGKYAYTETIAVLEESLASSEDLSRAYYMLYNALKKGEETEKGAVNKEGLAQSYANQALLLQTKGQFPAAMKLYIKVEKIREELGDRVGLATTYSNQALILQVMGRLDEAMNLLKKEEAIKEETGDRMGLAISYGNQALILQQMGHLFEAMALHKKEEKIKEELGDRMGLAISYGNQASILKNRGQLDDALKLHKKVEQIFEELGDRNGLANSYANQAMILRRKGQWEEAMRLLKKDEQIREELSDRAGMSNSYGNQAAILSEQGYLDEAIELFKKDEQICDELGDRVGLARAWWNQGIIYNKRKEFKTQAKLWAKTLQVNKELGLPVEEDQKLYDELMNKIEQD
ncbi:MAG: tetratricopeptide repeat protein [bacterium]|nr:tetratricopeptide repeat protein [bacterium]